MEATSNGSTSAQMPDADRKSGIPLSVLMPAPVRTTAGPRSRMRAVSSSAVPMRAIVGREIVVVRGASTPSAHDVRVRFAETDAQGIAHHASFVVWLEEARVAYLAAFTGGYRAIREKGIEALTTGVHLEYERAAVFDDVLTIRVRCAEIRGARFRYEYAVERDGVRIAAGWDDTCDGRRGHPPSDTCPGMVRRGRPQGRGAADDALGSAGALPVPSPAFAAGGTAGSSCAGAFGFGRGFVPIRTTVGSPT